MLGASMMHQIHYHPAAANAADAQPCDRVVAWEPVPIFRAFTYLNLALNNVSHLVTVRGTVAGEEDGKELEMHFQSAGNWGTASVDGMNQGSVFGQFHVQIVEHSQICIQHSQLYMQHGGNIRASPYGANTFGCSSVSIASMPARALSV